MKTSKYYWGVFFISLGFLFLAKSWNIINPDIEFLIKFWPVFLIIWGISFFNLNLILKRILSGLSGFLFALLLFSLISGGWRFGHRIFWHNHENKYEHLNKFEKYHSESYDSLFLFGNADINVGAGKLKIFKYTDNLFDANLDNFGNISINKDSLNRKVSVAFYNHDNDISFDKSEIINNIKLNFNNLILWDFNFDIGASKANIDLSEIRVKDIKLNAGAADINLTVGSINPNQNINIEAGASSVRIKIPDNVFCKVYSETALSGEDFIGFTETYDNTYFTGDQNNTKSINIRINGGVSSFRIQKY